MRRALLVVVAAVCLAVPAAASATTEIASGGGITAALTYHNGLGILTSGERLEISQGGRVVYDQPVPAKGCFKVCSPIANHGAVHVLDLYGDGEFEVVLDLFTGGASCCGMEQVYVPSASLGSWVLTAHNFGQDGAKIERLSGQVRFISGDTYFSCAFTDCAQSGLPLQVFSFTGDAFVNVTKRYPKLIAADAARWLKAYDANPKQGLGLIAPWAADEDNLGLESTVASVLAQQVQAHHVTTGFVTQLQSFLRRHHYTS